MFCFTPGYVLIDTSKFYLGYSMIGTVGLLVLVNLSFAGFRQVSRHFYVRNLKRKFKAKIDMFVKTKAEEVVFYIKQDLEEAEIKRKNEFLQAAYEKALKGKKPILQKIKLKNRPPRSYNKKMKIRPDILSSVEDENLRNMLAESINKALVEEIGTFGDLVEMARRQIVEDYADFVKKPKIIKFNKR